MARFCFLPPTKRPVSARQQTTGSKTRTGTSSMCSGMLKRLEPVLNTKKRLYKRGVNTEAKNNQSSPKDTQKVVKDSQQTPKKILPQVETKKPKRRAIRRELFPQKERESQKVRNVLEIVEDDEQTKKNPVNKDQFLFPDRVTGNQGPLKSSKTSKLKDSDDKLKKLKVLPTISKKRKKSINKSVLDIIRKTQQSIQQIRNQAAFGNTMSENSKYSTQEKLSNHDSKRTKTNLNVQVSICIPNSGIQKSECTVQQTGSIEEESIGYKHHRIKNYQDIQDLF